MLFGNEVSRPSIATLVSKLVSSLKVVSSLVSWPLQLPVVGQEQEK